MVKFIKSLLFLIVISTTLLSCSRKYELVFENKTKHQLKVKVKDKVISITPFSTTEKTEVKHRKSVFFSEAGIFIFVSSYIDSSNNEQEYNGAGLGLFDSDLKKKTIKITIEGDSSKFNITSDL